MRNDGQGGNQGPTINVKLLCVNAWSKLVFVVYFCCLLTVICFKVFYVSDPEAKTMVCISVCFCMSGYLFLLGLVRPIKWLRLPFAAVPVTLSPLAICYIDRGLNAQGLLVWSCVQFSVASAIAFVQFVVRRPVWVTDARYRPSSLTVRRMAVATLLVACLVVLLQSIDFEEYTYSVFSAIFLGPIVGFTLGLLLGNQSVKIQSGLLGLSCLLSVGCAAGSLHWGATVAQDVEILAIFAGGFAVLATVFLLHVIVDKRLVVHAD